MKKLILSILMLGVMMMTVMGVVSAVTDTFHPTSGYDTTSLGSHYLTSGELDDVDNSDNNRYTTDSRWQSQSYYDPEALEFYDFDVSFPSNLLSINSVTLNFEWQREWNIDGARIKVWDESTSSWTTYDLSIPSSGVDQLETISLISYIDNLDDLEKIIIKFQAHDGCCGLRTHHDLVELEVEYTEEPECVITVSKPDQGWYGSLVDVEWTVSQSCLADRWDLAYQEGSCNPFGTWDRFANTVLSPQSLDAIAEGLNEGSSYCIKVEGDNFGDEVGFSNTFKVDLTPPVITASDKTCNEGETITLTASATDTDGSGVDTSTWKWDLDGDSIFEESGSSVSYDCEDGPALETVQVKVSDNVGNEAEEAVEVTVNNVAPTVTDVSTSGTLYEGSSTTLSATASDPSSIFGDGDTPMTYSWDLSYDGTFSEDSALANPTLSCSEDGNIEVAVIATDEDSAPSAIYQETIVCENVAPVVESLSVNPNSIYEEESTTLTATVSDVGADDDTLTYVINWGDSSSTTSGSTTGAISETHKYMDDDADDTYTITLTVTDTDTATDVGTITITVLNLDPWNVDAGADKSAVVGEEVCFSGSATDVTADSLTYTWTFGDSSSGSGQHVCHTYSTKGPYTVTMTVDDSDGGVVSDTLTVTVYSYAIQLYIGWNLISIPLIPEDDNTSIGNVLDTISDNVEVVWAYTYDEGLDKNVWKYHNEVNGDLSKMVPGYGYYIKMTQDDILYQNGKKMYGNEEFVVPKPPVVTLTPSWNLIGHYGTLHVSKANALTTLGGSYATLLDEEGDARIMLSPTEGYWLFVTGTDVIDYAPSSWSYMPESV